MTKLQIFKAEYNVACQTSQVSSKGPVYLRLQLKGKNKIVFKCVYNKGT